IVPAEATASFAPTFVHDASRTFPSAIAALGTGASVTVYVPGAVGALRTPVAASTSASNNKSAVSPGCWTVDVQTPATLDRTTSTSASPTSAIESATTYFVLWI